MLHRKKKLTALIVGCGQFGAVLAQSLFDKGCSVTVIDRDEDAFRRLHDVYSGYTLLADGTSTAVLRQCGAERADILVASTEKDNVNILIAEIASTIFGIGKVYARLNDESKMELLDGLNIEPICPHRLCLAEFWNLSGMKGRRLDS